jgi:hypothetical protein
MSRDDRRPVLAKNLADNHHCVLTTGTDTLSGMDYAVEGTAALVTDQSDRNDVATAYEQAYGWRLTRTDGTWYQLGESVRSGRARLYRVQPVLAFAFGRMRIAPRFQPLREPRGR